MRQDWIRLPFPAFFLGVVYPSAHRIPVCCGPMMKPIVGAAALLVWPGLWVAHAAAQSTPAQDVPAAGETQTTQSTGITASVRFDGSHSPQGAFAQVVPRLGYDFSRWGVDVSLPLEYVGASSTAGTASHGGVGDLRLSLSFAATSSLLDFYSTATVTAPTGDSTIGLGAGESTWDWSNYVGHDFSRITPFVDVGVGSSLGSGTGRTSFTGAAGRTRTLATPYTTLGTLAHLDAGLELSVLGPLSWSASAYDTLPWGDQTVISLFVPLRQNGQPVGPRLQRAFEQRALTQGSASLTADHGFSTSLDLSPKPYLYLSVGFSRSVKMNLNVWTVSTTIRVEKFKTAS